MIYPEKAPEWLDAIIPASSKLSPRHKAALEYARNDIPVFPVEVGGKRPVTPHGFKDRTTDIDQINAWWGHADYNLALVPDDLGCYVIDIDGSIGAATWAKLCAENGGAPKTITIKTPGGGWHLYFAGSLHPSVSKLGEGIDIRSQGSYVLVPPSIIDGKEYVKL